MTHATRFVAVVVLVALVLLNVSCEAQTPEIGFEPEETEFARYGGQTPGSLRAGSVRRPVMLSRSSTLGMRMPPGEKSRRTMPRRCGGIGWRRTRATRTLRRT